jgi:3'-5' exoribonuclease
VVAQSAVNIDEFLPRANVDVTRLWDTVDKWRGEMKSQKLRTTVDLFFADDAFRARFERAPGAPRGHHAQIGGLLMYVVEVGSIARVSARLMGADVELVTAGALLCDIGKVEAYAISAAGFDVTASGATLGDAALGSLMLDRRLRSLPANSLSEDDELELQHFILSQPGHSEHGAAVKPATLEAELLNMAAQTSISAGSFREHR